VKTLVLFLAAIATLPGAAMSAQDISGNWQGTLWLDTSSLVKSDGPFRTVLQISKTDDGGWKAVYYENVAASKHPIPVASITFTDMNVKFLIKPMHRHYLGRLSADGTRITGTLDNDLLDFRRMEVDKRVTTSQLKQILAETNRMPDGTAAQKLYRLELTERLSEAKLSRYQADLPGIQDKQALMTVYDRSSFLDPPAAEIPAIATPDLAAQRKMIALSVDYVAKTIHQLPNLYATRVTTSFVDNLWEKKPFHPAGTYSATVLYRNGKERLQSSFFQLKAPGLTTSGEFGAILDDALLDAVPGKLSWDHWEQGPEGPEAVYRYNVAADKSHYVVDGLVSAYEGKIAIDPSNGTILRLVFRARLEPPNPLLTADIMVEYRPVELGGKIYICPVRSIALSRDLQLQWLNDVVFEHYHVYRASARILPGDTP
jgi:hypothetical protein